MGGAAIKKKPKYVTTRGEGDVEPEEIKVGELPDPLEQYCGLVTK